MQRLKSVIKGFINLMNAIWLYIPAFTVVCLIYYCLMAVSLAVDTLMITGEQLHKAIFLLPAMIFWSWVVWFSSRIVGLVEPKAINGGPIKASEPDLFKTHLPRFLAVNCFVALQCAILALRHVIDLSSWGIVLYILCQLLFFLFLTKTYNVEIEEKRKRFILKIAESRNPFKNRSAYWWVALAIKILYVFFLIGLSFYNCRNADGITISTNKDHTWNLPILSILLYILQDISINIYTKRKGFVQNPELFNNFFTRLIAKIKKTTISKIHWKVLVFIGLSKRNAAIEAPYYFLFHIVCAIGAIFYITGIFSIRFASYIGPLAFTILALSVLIVFFNLLGAFSRRINLSLSLFVLVLAYVVGNFSDNHSVRTVCKTSKEELLTPSTFTNSWMNNPVRKNQIINSSEVEPYVAYIVLSDGGGARAGTWTSLLLSTLEDTTKGEFGRHLFALGGASGGSVGNAAFYGLLKAKSLRLFTDTSNIYPFADRFFSSDFLTYTEGRFLGPDFFNYIFPFLGMDDRAAALEVSMENPACDTTIGLFFQSAIDTALDRSGRLPAWFINTTDVQSGMTSYISNIDINDSLRNNVLKRVCPDYTLRVSSSTILGARFPYISPAGEINHRYYVDGGYYDNSGAGTMLTFLRKAEEYIPDNLRKKIKFQIIELHNGPITVIENNHIHPLVNDMLAPVLTLVGMQDGTTRAGNQQIEQYTLADSLSINPIRLDLYTPEEKEEYPMSWVNSQYQLGRIRQRIDSLPKQDPTYVKLYTEIKEGIRITNGVY